MKRRAFFGLIGGAAVAGPGMVKAAAQQTIGDLQLPGAGLYPPSMGMPVSSSMSDWASRKLRRIVGRTAMQHDYFRRRTDVTALDPDIASWRSVALHRRISIQRDRNYERGLERDRGMFEAHIAGWFED